MFSNENALQTETQHHICQTDPERDTLTGLIIRSCLYLDGRLAETEAVQISEPEIS